MNAHSMKMKQISKKAWIKTTVNTSSTDDKQQKMEEKYEYSTKTNRVRALSRFFFDAKVIFRLFTNEFIVAACVTYSVLFVYFCARYTYLNEYIYVKCKQKEILSLCRFFAIHCKPTPFGCLYVDSMEENRNRKSLELSSVSNKRNTYFRLCSLKTTTFLCIMFFPVLDCVFDSILPYINNQTFFSIQT